MYLSSKKPLRSIDYESDLDKYKSTMRRVNNYSVSVRKYNKRLTSAGKIRSSDYCRRKLFKKKEDKKKATKQYK